MIAVVASSCFAKDIGRVQISVAQYKHAETLRSEWANLKCVLIHAFTLHNQSCPLVRRSLWMDVITGRNKFSYNAYTNGKPCYEMNRQVNSCRNTHNAKYELKRSKKKLTAASKLCENSLNSVSVSPSNMSEWEQLSRTLTIAWVAQALLITWKHKITIKQTLMFVHMLAHWKLNDETLKLQQITILGRINSLPIHVKLNKYSKKNSLYDVYERISQSKRRHPHSLLWPECLMS